MSLTDTERQAEWRRKNPDRAKAHRQRAWAKLRADPEQLERRKQYHKEWRAKNSDLVRAQTKRKLARLRADPESQARRKRYMQVWLANNPGKRAAYARKRHLRAAYGLTPAQFQRMEEDQGGKCAICQRVCKLHVDHRHTDGGVRGLLCGSCNRAIGLLGEEVSRLRSAVAYLEKCVEFP